ncbi:MAG TPA: cytochrome c [Candidatus Acidoferrales bacterium]|nr:cytochrome c [Candidatus Acidoferrales bacterium]
MRPSINLIAPGLATLLFLSGAWIPAAETDQGRELYLKYCSSCHGTDGRGSGPVSPFLTIKVPDLTLLRKNNKGLYPFDRVMSSIDGSRAVRGHGDREMPVWGEVFEKEARESDSGKYPRLTSLLKVQAIAEYVSTLQR